MKKENKNNNFLIIMVSFGVIALANFWFSKNDSFLKEVEDKEIKSIIIKKYINKENHNICYIIYDKDSIIVFQDWWDKISEGDSIIKPKGSVELLIKNQNKMEKFKYQDNLGLE
jgi:hypothetical protein